MLRLKK